MDRVAAEIAIEIRVLLENHDFDTGAGQQVTSQHPGRSAADDDAAGAEIRRQRSEVGDQTGTDWRRGMPRLSKIVRVASDLLSV